MPVCVLLSYRFCCLCARWGASCQHFSSIFPVESLVVLVLVLFPPLSVHLFHFVSGRLYRGILSCVLRVCDRHPLSPLTTSQQGQKQLFQFSKKKKKNKIIIEEKNKKKAIAASSSAICHLCRTPGHNERAFSAGGKGSHSTTANAILVLYNCTIRYQLHIHSHTRIPTKEYI